MTEFELKQYRCLQLEEKQLKEALLQLRSQYNIRAVNYENVKVSPTYNENDNICNIVTDVIELEQEYKLAIRRTIKKKVEIEHFIYNIDDTLLRVIFRERYLNHKSYRRISKELNYSTTVIFQRTSAFFNNIKKQ